MEWFAYHTNWLHRESKNLSTSSNYKELYQAIGRTFISTGNIIVHKNRTEYFPILIVYPEATPYTPPTIYILNSEISEDIAIRYSELSPAEISEQVKNNIKFFNRRHQGVDGSVCFVELGDFHSEHYEMYPIEDIIKRLRIWLSGKIPKDSPEVELFHHFKDRTYELEFLLPDLFFDEEIKKGNFYAGLAGLVPANNIPGKGVKKTYMGVMITSENQAGISLPPKKYLNEQLILFTPMPDLTDLILKNNSQKKASEIQEGNLIEGYWWEISEEPSPFSNIKELAQYIGNGNETEGLGELTSKLEQELNGLSEFIYVGIRFPGRVKITDWQFFRLQKGRRFPLVGGGVEESQERLLNYTAQAIYQEYFTDEYFHQRNTGRAERNLLKDTSVAVIGCGALGSETSDALAKAGVGNILLIDKEVMRAHNAVRHSLGINRTSIPKVLGMTEQLILHNPFIQVDWKYTDILHDKISEYFSENSIGISTIADDNVEAYLNQEAVQHGRTVFYCRALRGGKVARIFRVIPHKDACKACLALYLQDNNPVLVNIPEDENLPVITNECNNPVRPASAADMKIISGIFSRVIIDFLENKNSVNNHWIWSSDRLEGMGIDDSTYGAVKTSNIKPHPKCYTCHPLEKTTINIQKKVLDFIKCEAAGSGDIETGGVLIGQKKGHDEYTIFRASKPGPNAIRTNSIFEKDNTYCQKELLDAYSEQGEQGLYLGEWHYHPLGSNQPSGQDIKSLTEIAAQNNYRIDRPIMIILSPTL
ncbi:MAG: hypothetical protein D3917_06225, partial [Candidatus Electrothrix sp. AX5]|nr:hypothetical protein [Candidatus Electrothrix sp. AX5]